MAVLLTLLLDFQTLKHIHRDLAILNAKILYTTP